MTIAWYGQISGVIDPDPSGNRRNQRLKILARCLKPPAFVSCQFLQLPSGNRPPGNLSSCCCAVKRIAKIQSYANQSESGEARCAGSRSIDDGNASLDSILEYIDGCSLHAGAYLLCTIEAQLTDS